MNNFFVTWIYVTGAKVPLQAETVAVAELLRGRPGGTSMADLVAESELIGLLDGNFACYRLRPLEDFSWRTARDT